MERVLWKMLGEKMAEKRGHHLISLSLQSLARLMIRTSGLFAASKMTLRCRVASVHANELKPGEIDLVRLVPPLPKSLRLFQANISIM